MHTCLKSHSRRIFTSFIAVAALGVACDDGGDPPPAKERAVRSADGSDFDPAGHMALAAWLLAAKATNMANMLSAQLAAMAMNVAEGFVSGGALVYAPGSRTANANGFTTVQALMDEADASLALHANTPSGHAERAYQEALKNALDNANNNRTFVQPTPATCPAPLFVAPSLPV